MYKVKKRTGDLISFDISKISENLGFSDTSSFIRYFKKSEGITPKQYRTSNTEK